MDIAWAYRSWRKSDIPLPSYGQKRRFALWHPSAILNLKVFSFGRRIFVIVLIIVLICIVLQKFHQNLMIFHRDMAIQWSSSLRSSAMLYFQSLTPPNQRLVVQIRCSEFYRLFVRAKRQPRTGIRYTDACTSPPRIMHVWTWCRQDLLEAPLSRCKCKSAVWWKQLISNKIRPVL